MVAWTIEWKQPPSAPLLIHFLRKLRYVPAWIVAEHYKPESVKSHKRRSMVDIIDH